MGPAFKADSLEGGRVVAPQVASLYGMRYWRSQIGFADSVQYLGGMRLEAVAAKTVRERY